MLRASSNQGSSSASLQGEPSVVQGVEAGGHVRSTLPGLELLERTRAAIDLPLLLAGGIVDRIGVRAALEAGAVGAVAGTRFLLAEESRAHPEYKRLCVDANETLLTELFGFGWPRAPHRVIPNEATRRRLGDDRRGPAWLRAGNRLTSPLVALAPHAVQARALRPQRWTQPFLGPQPPTDDGPPNLLDSGPLYAGAGVTPSARSVRRPNWSSCSHPEGATDLRPGSAQRADR